MLSYVRQVLGIGLVPGLALQRDDRRQLTVEPADTPSIDVRLACRATLKGTSRSRCFSTGWSRKRSKPLEVGPPDATRITSFQHRGR
jgi:hypothetical protein